MRRPPPSFRLALLASGLALATGCAVDCSVDAPLDYTDDANWLCRPGVDTACPASYDVAEVAEDGTVTHTTLDRATDPSLACFAVYPTLDLRLREGLHRDLTSLDGPAEWVRSQAGPMQADCDSWAPVYRQVTIGTYVNADRTTGNISTCSRVAEGWWSGAGQAGRPLEGVLGGRTFSQVARGGEARVG